MPSRRFHSKSRHGCIACKARRVKCDLERPQCRNCARRNEQCELTQDLQDRSLRSPGTSPRINTQSTLRDLCSRPSDPELVLFERFCSQVSVTLSGRKEAQRLWASTVDQKTSYKYPYLAHCVLAISALHLSETSHPSAAEALNHRAQAIYYQNTALSLLGPQLVNVNAENCNALYASAVLVFLFTAAFPRPSDKSTLLDEIVEMSEIAKGVPAVLKGSPGDLSAGPLRAWFTFHHWESPNSLLPGHISQSLRRMRESIDKFAVEDKRKIYISAVEKLKLALAAFAVNTFHPAFIFMWLAEVDRGFLDLVKSRDRIALYIFGHYGTCALGIKDRWWARTWGEDIVNAVQRVFEGSDTQTRLAEQPRQFEAS